MGLISKDIIVTRKGLFRFVTREIDIFVLVFWNSFTTRKFQCPHCDFLNRDKELLEIYSVYIVFIDIWLQLLITIDNVVMKIENCVHALLHDRIAELLPFCFETLWFEVSESQLEHCNGYQWCVMVCAAGGGDNTGGSSWTLW